MEIHDSRPSPVVRVPVIEVIDPEMAAVIRSKTGAERLQIANGMYRSARQMILSHLRSEHPDWDERRLLEATAQRLSRLGE